MFKNLKLRAKMAIDFGSLIVIPMALGTLAVDQKDEIGILADALRNIEDSTTMEAI